MPTPQRSVFRSAPRIQVLCGALAVWLVAAIAPGARGQQEGAGAPAVDEVTRSNVLTILSRIGLDLESCAALNLTSEQAHAVIGAARSWYENNQADWQAACTNLAVARDDWSSAGTETNEPVDPAAAAEAVRTAELNLVNTLAPLRTSIQGTLSASQRELWAVLEVHAGVPYPERLLVLTAEQRAQLADVRQRTAADLAAATSEAAREAVLAAEDQAVATVLPDSGESFLATYQSYVQTSMANVVAAAADVFGSATTP